jgi:hypothetical protein
LGSIHIAPENSEIYAAIRSDDPAILELAQDIALKGIQDELLVSSDHYLISGHRRLTAARIAGKWKVPVRVMPEISYAKNHAEFLKRLVAMNSQRHKSPSDMLHEEIVKTDPKKASQQLKNERLEKGKNGDRKNLSVIDPIGYFGRCKLSAAKQPLLDAILLVLDKQEDYWPISVRQVFYRLLGPDAPRLHASKQELLDNNIKSYRAVVDVVARGRIEGLVPWAAIDDTTRPIDLNDFYDNPAQFFREEFENFLKGYCRNRQRSQPDHIEIALEKLTMRAFVNRVAQEYTIPLSTLRGMGTTGPKHKVATRFRASGKDKLILLVITDLDPAGDTIAENLVNDFREDYGITNIEAYKVALTIDQVEQFELEPSMDAKEDSPTYKKYVERYGDRVLRYDEQKGREVPKAFELDAMDPSQAEDVLHSAIRAVMDIDRYNTEMAAEEADSREIIAVRELTDKFLKSLKVT